MINFIIYMIFCLLLWVAMTLALMAFGVPLEAAVITAGLGAAGLLYEMSKRRMGR